MAALHVLRMTTANNKSRFCRANVWW